MKNLSIFLILVLLVFACKNETPKEEAEVVETKLEAVNITFDEFKSSPENYVDKLVRVEGTCVHTCKHGGKKMHIIGEDPDYTIKVEASDKVAMFDKTLEGSGVLVEGFVRAQRITETYLNNWEEELEKDMEEQKESGEVSEEHHESMGQIANMRKTLEESGKEEISYYSIECQNFEEKEAIVEEIKDNTEE